MSELDEEIDGPGGSVFHPSSGKVFATTILPFGSLSTEQLSELPQWRFDWALEARRVGREVVGLVASTTIQGLVSLEAKQRYVLVHLLESAPHNVGQNKLYRGVAANLFAFACARSFALKFEGFVTFEAKSALIEHYKLSLGAQQIGASNRMIIDADRALQLVKHNFKEADRWPL